MADEPQPWRRVAATPLAWPGERKTADPLASPRPSLRHPSQLTVLLIGIVYVAIGVVGLLLDRDRAGEPQRVLGFQLGLVHDLVRVNVGLLGLAMWTELRTARSYGKLLSAGYGLSIVLGLLFGGAQLGIPPLYGPDGLLHLGNAAAAHWPKARGSGAECACGPAVQARTLGEPCIMAACVGQAGGERGVAAAQAGRARL
jgi:hypothetical protein